MKGKVAFITGAANGIGRATARTFVELGANVAISDINGKALSEAVDELRPIGPKILPIEADLSALQNLDGYMQSAVREFGQVDYLINCAARLDGTNDFLKVTEQEWDRELQLNLKMPMFLMQAFANHAIQRGGGGRIVVVSSSGAFRGLKNRPAYSSSKGGLTSLVRIAAAQLGPHNINVNAVAPGTTNTYGTTTARNLDPSVLQKSVSEGPTANFFKRVSEPEDIAATIAFLCTPGSRQITGQTIHVSAGQILP